ncbi:deoxyribonuclease IV [Myxococcota bacterium]|nr:deoxyribonuclease IV [Myxococcota bacterium]MBU1534487.1 deoxyribonuclease IV [Myxococcota bacterium]
MKFIGAHVSISGGVDQGPLNARAIGADAMAIFTKNQRQWVSPPLEAASIAAFHAHLAQAQIAPQNVLVHDSYLINMGNPDPAKSAKAIDAFIEEAKRVEALGLTLLNFHPGSHLKAISEEACLDQIARAMNETLARTRSCVLVIENTAGQGTNVGYRFEHLAQLLDRAEDKSRVGVCIDTCHLFASGYELRGDAFDATWAEFDRLVGFSFLRGMHLNDAVKECGSRVDRHASLGKGCIGTEPFQRIMGDSRFDGIPLILETPAPDLWAEEIALLRGFI